MSREFEVRKEITLDATPEQVWEAIATGPGIDSWFMGRNEIDPREGGTNTFTLAGHAQTSTVTAWEPLKRFAFRGETKDDGTSMAFEYLIEGRDSGSTVLRLVQSGFLGDDWETEYDALSKGWEIYLHSLREYLTHFPGRTATPVGVFGPPQAGEQEVWDGFKRGLGLTGTVSVGDRAGFTLAGAAPVEGVVDVVSEPLVIGVRTADGLYRFMGRGGAVVLGHHVFDAARPDELDDAWRAWLDDLFAGREERTA